MEKKIALAKEIIDKAVRGEISPLTALKEIFGENYELVDEFVPFGYNTTELICRLIKLAGLRDDEKYQLISESIEVSLSMGFEIFLLLIRCIKDIIDYEIIIDIIKKALENKDINYIIKEIHFLSSKSDEYMVPIAIILPALKDIANSRFINYLINKISKKRDKETSKWLFKAMSYLVDLLGGTRVIRYISSFFSEKKAWWRFDDIALASLCSLRQIYLTTDMKDDVLRILDEILSAKNLPDKLLRRVVFSYDHNEVSSLFWAIYLFPEKFDAKKTLTSAIACLKKHGEKISFEVSSALEKIVTKLNNKDFYILGRLAYHEDYRIRLGIAMTLAKLLNEGDIRALKFLWSLARDKRSIVRRVACSALINNLNNLNEDNYKITLYALIRSGWSVAIEAALSSLIGHEKEIPISDLKNIVSIISRDPRSIVLRNLLDILSIHWTYFDQEFIMESLSRVVNYVGNRRELFEAFENLVLDIAKYLANNHNITALKKLQKIILGSALWESQKKRLLSLLRQIARQFNFSSQ